MSVESSSEVVESGDQRVVIELEGLAFEPVPMPLVSFQNLLQVDYEQGLVAQILVLHHWHPIPKAERQVVRGLQRQHQADIALDLVQVGLFQPPNLAGLRVNLMYFDIFAVMDFHPHKSPSIWQLDSIYQSALS
ncbi:hypothetical protein OGATHE_003095 [Ogataea polymorpha]|uniref:Uncharacterized protein n=1 Tax=Ogataea polymorpha TaxID=460523 RepID=A0A9P8PA40_9ASCO|nr:hypothetical protein OGATHE_003095 [Ogataea polymorpha]